MEQCKRIDKAVNVFFAAAQRNQSLYEMRTHLEEYFADRPYQMMAVYQRSRHKGEKGENWPDKPESAPAASHYPNILAELDASGWWLDGIARSARVSMEIMASAMEDNGELSRDELDGLARHFGCKLDYLAAPVLSMVEPATNKGSGYIQHLKDLLKWTEGMDRYFYRKNSSDVLPKLESGKPVTYAAYRWACKNLQSVLDAQVREEARRRSIRTGEISPAQVREEVQTDLMTRLQQTRERANAQKLKDRLAEIRKYVDNTNPKNGRSNSKDLLALAEFSKLDLCGALLLAIMYGQAQGYQVAKAEVETQQSVKIEAITGNKKVALA